MFSVNVWQSTCGFCILAWGHACWFEREGREGQRERDIDVTGTHRSVSSHTHLNRNPTCALAGNQTCSLSVSGDDTPAKWTTPATATKHIHLKTGEKRNTFIPKSVLSVADETKFIHFESRKLYWMKFSWSGLTLSTPTCAQKSRALTAVMEANPAEGPSSAAHSTDCETARERVTQCGSEAVAHFPMAEQRPSLPSQSRGPGMAAGILFSTHSRVYILDN